MGAQSRSPEPQHPQSCSQLARERPEPQPTRARARACAQFALLEAQALYGVFGAPYYRPRIVVELAIVQAVVFTLLFGSFYRCGLCFHTPHPSIALLSAAACTCRSSQRVDLSRMKGPRNVHWGACRKAYMAKKEHLP